MEAASTECVCGLWRNIIGVLRDADFMLSVRNL